jgi:MraZ protein
MPPLVGFFGQHDLKIDAKSRVTMPARFKSMLREQFPQDDEQVVVRLNMDQSLTVESVSRFAQVVEDFDQYDELDENTRRYKQLMTALATVEKIDAGGRIRLSGDLRRMAGIEHDVIVIGRSNSCEIWARERWGPSATRRWAICRSSRAGCVRST